MDCLNLPDGVILKDEEIRDLTDFVPFSEGDRLADMETELNLVKQALARAETGPYSANAWIAALLRGMYLLGVMRGAEAYRDLLGDLEGTELRPDMELRMDKGCAEEFADELRFVGDTYLKGLWAR